MLKRNYDQISALVHCADVLIIFEYTNNWGKNTINKFFHFLEMKH